MRLRETGSVSFLDLATRAAQASLRAMPETQNLGAVAVLAQSEQASHDFRAARGHAERLVELAPDHSEAYQILGDALLELGEYEPARAAFAHMQQQVEQSAESRVNLDTRLGQLAWLEGDVEAARTHFSQALAGTLEEPSMSGETVAWCHWRLGELAFATGDYAGAERAYTDSLAAFPDYYRALAGLGRTRAARGDLEGATRFFERATTILPDPGFVATLGDLYQLAGRRDDAAAQYALVKQIATLSALNGNLYNRQLALFDADHDRELEQAYALATSEYAARRDVYGADAVAWTALKAGKLPEAQAAMRDALHLGTRDARLFYHAGMIARAAGDPAGAHDQLDRALELSPGFDPMQAGVARRVREELKG